MRAFVLVMDSFGIGGAPDAENFGDGGANTLGSIAAACAAGDADVPGERTGVLRVPNLARLGLARACAGASGSWPAGLADVAVAASAGHASELSRGKDTPSGHWEIAGVVTDFDWGYFPTTASCFPAPQLERLIADGGLPGTLGNCHASGTEIIKELGEEHIRTGKPICYASADSVFQIAAHEVHFGLQRLYDLCLCAKAIFDPLRIARVIARPFIGETPEDFTRTANRRDYTTPPHGVTLLDTLVESGAEVVSIGKIADIFAGRGITRTLKGGDNMALFDHLLAETARAPHDSLVFANFVDFDMLYGHRRNIAGYAQALERFDRRLPELERALQPGDIALITADHGCDPTFPGSDHTREQVPVLFFGPGVEARDLGQCDSFADMGQTLAHLYGLTPLVAGNVLPVSMASE